MKINSIINRYIFKEMLIPVSIGIMFFTFVCLMAQMVEISNLIVNYSVSVVTVLLIIFYSLPQFMVFVLPMSIMMSILLTFLRLSSDNEITALKSGGHSIYRLLPPVLILCFIGFAFTISLTIYGMPWGRRAIKDLTYQAMASNVDIGLKERTFNDSFKDVMLYVNKVDFKNKMLIDIFIEDKRRRDLVSTVIAPKGRLFSESDKFVFHLLLFNGTIHQTSLEDRLANSINFDTYKISLDLHNDLMAEKRKSKHRSEMNLGELIQYIDEFPTKDKDYYKALLELHQKFSLPFACIALSILAMPLGVQSKSAKRSFGLILGLFFFLIYYLLLSAGVVFGKTGNIPPLIGMWLPNIVMGATGTYLLLRTANEKPLGIAYFVSYFLRFFVKVDRGSR